MLDSVHRYGILQYGDQRADVCRVEPDNGDNAIISKTGAMLNTLEWLKRRRACGVQNIDSALELRDKAPPPVPLLRASEHGKGGVRVAGCKTCPLHLYLLLVRVDDR